MQTITYAIGDIHGRLDLLNQLLDRIEADSLSHAARAKIVFTGDYMDRGPHSFGVVERLIAGPRRPDDRFVCLRGNHDHLFVEAVTTGEGLPEWAWILYWHTIESYGVTRQTLGPDVSELRRHAEFLAGLPLTHDDGRHLFVHAGIRPGVAIEAQSDHDLMWIREEFLDHTRPLPRRVVHGHTIMGPSPVMTPNRISIDTGAYRSGILTAAVLEGADVRILQAIGGPDRGAIVREALLAARIAGRAISPATQRLLDEFMAGGLEPEELAERLLTKAA